MKKVTIYSTESCHYCHLAKDFFKENNISFEDHDVGTDINKRREMMEKSGQMGVPVIKIDDEIIIGFDQGRIKTILGI